MRVKCSLRPSEPTVYHDVSGATDVDDLIRTVSQTPLPTILVLAGIAFWILAIAGSLAGKITIDPSRQWAAGAVGSAFVGLGLILFFVSGQKATHRHRHQRRLRRRLRRLPRCSHRRPRLQSPSSVLSRLHLRRRLRPIHHPSRGRALASIALAPGLRTKWQSAATRLWRRSIENYSISTQRS